MGLGLILEGRLGWRRKRFCQTDGSLKDQTFFQSKAADRSQKELINTQRKHPTESTRGRSFTELKSEQKSVRPAAVTRSPSSQHGRSPVMMVDRVTDRFPNLRAFTRLICSETRRSAVIVDRFVHQRAVTDSFTKSFYLWQFVMFLKNLNMNKLFFFSRVKQYFLYFIFSSEQRFNEDPEDCDPLPYQLF